VFEEEGALARSAAEEAATRLREAVATRGEARLMLATGTSQVRFLDALREAPGVPWEGVTAFHLDEYLGLPARHPASFRRFLRERLLDHVPVRAFHGIAGDAADVEAERRRYAELLARAAPIDVACIGIGENGHIAFNEPGDADFSDPERVRRVRLDDRSRRQQVGEGHFAELGDVPREALTVTVPTIVASRAILTIVPDARKAEAVARAVTGPVDASCPASILQRVPGAILFLDRGSAARLPGGGEGDAPGA
jgi:glucosamine-6-phosphate deaminase